MCDPILLVSASHGSGVDESAGDYMLFWKALSNVLCAHVVSLAAACFICILRRKSSALRAITLMVQC